MRRGEKGIVVLTLAVVVVLGGVNIWRASTQRPDPGIPFYSTASSEVARKAGDLYKHYQCKNCHSLWSIRDMTANVPAPALDGIGSLRDEQWFYAYFSAPNPQAILPSRLKKSYQMPSFAMLAEDERRVLAQYMASLKVKDWYLDETRKAEYRKLTGRDDWPPKAAP